MEYFPLYPIPNKNLQWTLHSWFYMDLFFLLVLFQRLVWASYVFCFSLQTCANTTRISPVSPAQLIPVTTRGPDPICDMTFVFYFLTSSWLYDLDCILYISRNNFHPNTENIDTSWHSHFTTQDYLHPSRLLFDLQQCYTFHLDTCKWDLSSCP